MEISSIEPNRSTVSHKSKIKVYFENTIGKGTFGQVKYCVANVNNETIGFAVKIIDKKSSVYKCNKSAINREIIISKKVNHPSLIKFIKIIIHSSYVYMYMEYCKYTVLLLINSDCDNIITPTDPIDICKYLILTKSIYII